MHLGNHGRQPFHLAPGKGPKIGIKSGDSIDLEKWAEKVDGDLSVKLAAIRSVETDPAVLSGVRSGTLSLAMPD